MHKQLMTLLIWSALSIVAPAYSEAFSTYVGGLVKDVCSGTPINGASVTVKLGTTTLASDSTNTSLTRNYSYYLGDHSKGKTFSLSAGKDAEQCFPNIGCVTRVVYYSKTQNVTIPITYIGTWTGTSNFELLHNLDQAPTAITGSFNDGRVSVVNTTSAYLRGNLNSRDKSESSQYYFQYGTTTGYGSTTSTTTVSGPNTVNVEKYISGLAADTSYHYRLVATSCAGTTYGSDMSFKTNAVPIANSASYTINEDNLLTGTVTGSDSDGGSLLFYTYVNGSIGNVSINSSTGAFTYTPNANSYGTDIFKFRTYDGNEYSAPASITITINQVNDTPIVVRDYLNTNEDTSLVINTGENLVKNPSAEADLEGKSLKDWQVVSGTNWQPNKSNATITAYRGDYFFYAGAGATAEIRQDVDVSAYKAAIDANNQRFSFSAYVRSWPQSPPDTSKIIVEYLDSNHVSILSTFNSGDIGSMAGWQRVSDNRLAPKGTSWIRIRLISTRANNGGTNNDGYFDAISLSPDGGILGNDTDADLDALTIYTFNSSAQNGGSIIDNGNGTLTYTPAEDFNSNQTGQYDIFRYYAQDWDGSRSSEWVFIYVYAVNDKPAANAFSFTINEDAGYSGTVSGSDVDGHSLTYHLYGGDDWLGVSLNNSTGAFTLGTHPHVNGTGSFAFRVFDGQVYSDSATVNITVTSINDPPSFTKGSDQTIYNNEGSQVISDWATNIGPGGWTDESGQTLTFSASTQQASLFDGEGGQPFIYSDGKLTYSPAVGADGTANITLTLTDSGNPSKSVTDNFNITVKSPPAFKFQQMWPALLGPYYFPEATKMRVAVDAEGNFYISDAEKEGIWAFTENGQFIKFWPTENTSGVSVVPRGITIHYGAGDIYVVTDEPGVNVYDKDGQFIDSWGQGDLATPEDIAVDPNMNLAYIADSGYSDVRSFDLKGVMEQKFDTFYSLSKAPISTFDQPNGITVDINTGEVYLIDRGNADSSFNNRHFVYRLQPGNNNQFQIWITPDNPWAPINPQGLSVNSNDRLLDKPYISISCETLFSGTAKPIVLAYDSSGAIFKTSQFTEFTHDIAVNQSTGSKYVATNHRILVTTGFMLNNNSVDIGARGSAPGRFYYPQGVVKHNDTLFVSDSFNSRIQLLNNNDFTEWTAGGQIDTPLGLAVDPTGSYLYVADSGNNKILKLDLNTGSFLSSFGRALFKPYSLAVNVNGDIYVIDQAHNALVVFDQFGTELGTITNFPGKTKTYTLSEPSAIAIDDSGTIYIADTGNNRILFRKTGSSSWSAWTTTSPLGLAVHPVTGNIYVSQLETNAIQIYTPSEQLLTTFSGYGINPGLSNIPGFISVESDNSTNPPTTDLYVSDRYNNRIQKFTSYNPTAPGAKAIIVGGRRSIDDPLWRATELNADKAYSVLQYRGFSVDNINYLSHGFGDNPKVNSQATLVNLKAAIDGAAGSKDLVIYFADHGNDGYFYLNENEILEASTLAQWLDELQNPQLDPTRSPLSETLILVYDACRSGTFLQPLAGNKRIVITSTSSNELAQFPSQGTISFSNYFWDSVFSGEPVGNSFLNAEEGIFAFTNASQNPRLDDSGNGLHNTPSASLHKGIGNSTKNQGVMPTILSSSADSATGTIAATVCYEGCTPACYPDCTSEESKNCIFNVSADIIPPDLLPSQSTSPLLDIPSVTLQNKSSVRSDCNGFPNELITTYEGVYKGFESDGEYILKITATDHVGKKSAPFIHQVTNANPLKRRALILVGGSATDSEWDNVKNMANNAYDALRSQGYANGVIEILSNDPISPGTLYTSPTNTNIQTLLETTLDGTNTKDLVLYMVGTKGCYESLTLSSTDILRASDLSLWLTTFQNKIEGPVSVIYDATMSGSFMRPLAPTGDHKRIVITSTSNYQEAQFGINGSSSFSKFFWDGIRNATNVRDSYLLAKNNLPVIFESFPQSPRLDDNGNGIGDEKGKEGVDNDGLYAKNHIIGHGILYGPGNVEIARAAAEPAYLITGADKPLIWAEVSIANPNSISLRAIITPPGMAEGSINDPCNQIQRLNEILLFYNPSTDRYESPQNYQFDFSGFGSYTISIYVQDNSNDSISGIYQTTVFQGGGADQYPNEDSFENAVPIVVNNPVAQQHKFEKEGDKDWVKFYGLSGQTYDITTSNVGHAADLQISLYPENNQGEPIKLIDDTGLGEAEIYSFPCQIDGIYYLEIENVTGAFGDFTQYEIEVIRYVAPNNGTIRGLITDSKTLLPVSNSLVQLKTLSGLQNVGANITSTAGNFKIVAEANEYKVVVSAVNYELKALSSKEIFEGEELRVDVDIDPINSPPQFTSTCPKTAVEDTLYSCVISTTDVNPITWDSRVISATLLPDWLTLIDLENGTATLSGTPLNNHVGTNVIQLWVSDSSSNTANQSFAIHVINRNDLPNGSVAIPSNSTEDALVVAETSSIGDDDGLGTFLYTWQRSDDGTIWFNIANASNAAYPPGDDDVDKRLRVIVSYVDGHGTSEYLTSNTSIVANINDAPIASASCPTSITETDFGSLLDASESSDIDPGDSLSYVWQQLPGLLNATIHNSDSALASFDPPDVNFDGTTITFEVQVSDLSGATDTETCSVVINWVPITSAGPDQSANERDFVTLIGVADQDEIIMSILWSQTGGGQKVVLTSTTNLTTGFHAPNVAENTSEDLVFELAITYTEGRTTTDTVVITVNDIPEDFDHDDDVDGKDLADFADDVGSSSHQTTVKEFADEYGK